MKRSRNEIGVGILVALGLSAALFMAVQAGGFRSASGMKVQADFRDVGGLATDAAVTLAGVRIGAVDRIETVDGAARVHLVVDRKVPVPKSCRAEIRARSLLGEKYLALVSSRHVGPWLEEGDIITETRSPVEIDQLVRLLGPMLDSVDGEDLGALLGSLAELLAATDEDGNTLAENLNAAARDSAELASELNRQVPGTLEDLRHGAARLPGALDELDGALSDARSLIEDARRGTRSLPDLMERAGGIIDHLEPASANLHELSSDARELLTRLDAMAAGLEGVDARFLIRLFREHGILVRLRPSEIDEDGDMKRVPRHHPQPAFEAAPAP
jgi:phospholipid/cholesterol/gamma-HCH transport system substrate-binding protein